MRSAIFLAGMFIADAIRPEWIDGSVEFLSFVFIAFVIMDICDFAKKVK